MTQVPQLSPQDMDRLSRLAYNLAHNEKTRPYFAQLVKAVDPQTSKAFSDVFLDQKLAQFKQSLDNEKMQEKIAKVSENRDAQKREVIRQRGYNAEQVKALENIQVQYGFTDWKAAADIYAQRNPPDDPRLKPPPEHMMDGASWDFPTVPGADGKMLAFKDYIQDPRKYSRNTAYQMITEFKRGKLPAAFHGT
jgi:hypothetical protein